MCLSKSFHKVYDQFVDEPGIKLERQVAALKLGNGHDEDTQQGPLINETAVKKVHVL